MQVRCTAPNHRPEMRRRRLGL